MTAFIDRWYDTIKEAKRGVVQAGYMSRHVEIYPQGEHWRFRLNEAGLASQEASRAEAMPMKKLPKHLKLKERKKLDAAVSDDTKE